MEARVRKWGNSMAIRIPQPLAEDWGLKENSAVDISIRSGKLIVSPKNQKYSLTQLLKGITKNNLHEPVDWNK